MRIVDPKDSKGRRLLHEGDLENIPTYEDIRILNSKEIIGKVEILHSIPPSSVAFTNDYNSLKNKPDITGAVRAGVTPVEERVKALEESALTMDDVTSASATYTGEITFAKKLNPAGGISMNGVLDIGYTGGERSKISSSLPLALDAPSIILPANINVPGDAHYTSYSNMAGQVSINTDDIAHLKGRVTIVEQAVGKVEPSSEVKPGAGLVSADAIIAFVGDNIVKLKGEITPSPVLVPEAQYVTGSAVVKYVDARVAEMRTECIPSEVLEPGHAHTTSDAVIEYISIQRREIMDEVATSLTRFVDGPTLENRVKDFITAKNLEGLATLKEVDDKISEYDKGKVFLDEVDEHSPLPVKSSGIWKALEATSGVFWINQYREILEHLLKDRRTLEYSTIHLLYSKSPTIMAVIQQMEVREDDMGVSESKLTPEEWEMVRQVTDKRSQLEEFLSRTKVHNSSGQPVQDLPLYTGEVIREEEVKCIREMVPFKDALLVLLSGAVGNGAESPAS